MASYLSAFQAVPLHLQLQLFTILSKIKWDGDCLHVTAVFHSIMRWFMPTIIVGTEFTLNLYRLIAT